MATKKNRCFNSTKASETIKVGNVNDFPVSKEAQQFINTIKNGIDKSSLYFPLDGTSKFLMNHLKEDPRIPNDFTEELYWHFRTEPRSIQRQMAKSFLNVMIWGDCEYWEYAKTDDEGVNDCLNSLFKEYCWYTRGFEYLHNLNYNFKEAKAFHDAVNDFYHKKHTSFMDYLKNGI